MRCFLFRRPVKKCRLSGRDRDVVCVLGSARMLTRRTMISTAGGLLVSAGLGRGFAARNTAKTSLGFEIPPGACDSHIHVIGDPVVFPMSRDRDYTPPRSTTDDYKRMQQGLHCERAIIVTPTIYGSDNSATLDAIRVLGRDRARGVGLIDARASSSHLDSIALDGIVGIRLFLAGDGPFNPAVAARRLRAGIETAAKRGWHVQISTPPDVIASVAKHLKSFRVPVVLDYFAWIQGGVDQPGFGTVLSLLKAGHIYVKLAEPYRLSKDAPDYQDLNPVIQALVAANPDRILWGSGWPHVDSSPPVGHAKTDLLPDLPVDTVHLLNLLPAWVPDAEIRRKILVDNPSRLYGFQT